MHFRQCVDWAEERIYTNSTFQFQLEVLTSYGDWHQTHLHGVPSKTENRVDAAAAKSLQSCLTLCDPIGNKLQHTSCPDLLLLSELCVYEISAFILSSVKQESHTYQELFWELVNYFLRSSNCLAHIAGTVEMSASIKTFFYWSMVDLKECVSFRWKAKSISYHISIHFFRFFS